MQVLVDGGGGAAGVVDGGDDKVGAVVGVTGGEEAGAGGGQVGVHGDSAAAEGKPGGAGRLITDVEAQGQDEGIDGDLELGTGDGDRSRAAGVVGFAGPGA